MWTRADGICTVLCCKCKTRQHIDCVNVSIRTETDSYESYICFKCEPRSENPEIKIAAKTEEGYQKYLTLMRGEELQVRITDTVYMLRDIPIIDDESSAMHNYKTINNIDYSNCDVFRVVNLWKDENGQRFVHGHHYLRPNETYRKRTAKFYENEIVRVSIYETVPIELIMGRCWVMDPTNFCQGWPTNSIESHIYICEQQANKMKQNIIKIPKASKYSKSKA